MDRRSSHCYTPVVRTTTAKQLHRSVEKIVAAFEEDPVVRWIYPDLDRYQRYFPRIARLHAASTMDGGGAYHNDFGAAFWYPPDLEPDSGPLAGILEESLNEGEKATVYTLLGEMAGHHIPQPHWYLRLIGVVPGRQRSGTGAELMAPVLQECDNARLPAYLEATSERSIPFYERHGFEVVAEVRSRHSPALWPMVREAQ